MCRFTNRASSEKKDEESGALLKDEAGAVEVARAPQPEADKGGAAITKAGLRVLVLLAVQNCLKNLVMRAAVKGGSNFMYSAAVIGTEGSKFTFSFIYILCTGGTPTSVLRYLRLEWRKFMLLAIPAGIYNLQQTLEYVALRNLDAAVFSVIVQTKLLTTAIFSAVLMGKKLKRAQVLSLGLLTSGVMLAQLSSASGADAGEDGSGESRMKGVAATLGIALSSGFAAVYTEKVIKAARRDAGTPQATSSGGGTGGHPGLAYTQIQLALTSLVIEGSWAAVNDGAEILDKGLFHGVDYKAAISIVNSAIGGLTVAAVLKFADAVLKGYATAVSVMLTGLLSMLLFGTTLSVTYYLGMMNVMISIVLYNAKDLSQNAW